MWETLFNDHTVVNKNDPIGNLPIKTHLVRDLQHGHTVKGQLFHDPQHLANHFRVEGTDHFVKRHYLSFHGQGTADGDLLL